MIFVQLFYEFFKIGLFAVGGGMATLPFLQALSQKTGWFTTDFITNMIAISESTPGPIGINMATYVGFNLCGVLCPGEGQRKPSGGSCVLWSAPHGDRVDCCCRL